MLAGVIYADVNSGLIMLFIVRRTATHGFRHPRSFLLLEKLKSAKGVAKSYFSLALIFSLLRLAP